MSPTPVSGAETLARIFDKAGREHANRIAFRTRQADGTHAGTTYGELHSKALALASALIELGVGRGDRVALLSDNRLEWMVCDWAILFAGGADVPRGTDVTDADVRHILAHSDAVAVLVENRKVLDRVLANRGAYPNIRYIIAMEPGLEATGGSSTLDELIARGEGLLAAGDRRAAQRIAEGSPGDIATIIYTSGTTGVPKGVVLTHANLTSQLRNLPVAIGPEDELLSLLPIWHAYERVVEYVSLVRGACTTYTSVRTVGEDLKKVRPTFMASAPRLWESLHQRILNGVRSAPATRRALFHAAVAVAGWFRGSLTFLQGHELDLEGRAPLVSAGLGCLHGLRLAASALPFLVLDALVLRKVREGLGGRLRATISGGGALPLHIDAFMNNAGIPVLEGYGLTETSPVLAVRLEGKVVIGTVGPAYPETELRIVDLSSARVLYPDPSHPHGGRGLRGEIQARGPQVMAGYHKQPEATAAVLRDGWFSTGDIGIMSFNNCLRIVGRSKETIVLLSGENVEPGPIEAKLTESPLILQAMVIGQDAKQLGALLVPNLEGWKAAGVAAKNLPELIAHPQFSARMESEVRRRVSRETGFKSFELVQEWKAIAKPFEVGDELTATYKLKRHVITAKYAPGERP